MALLQAKQNHRRFLPLPFLSRDIPSSLVSSLSTHRPVALHLHLCPLNCTIIFKKKTKNIMFQSTTAAAVSALTRLLRKTEHKPQAWMSRVQKHRRRDQPSAFANNQFLQQTLQVLPHLPSPEGLSCISAQPNSRNHPAPLPICSQEATLKKAENSRDN